MTYSHWEKWGKGGNFTLLKWQWERIPSAAPACVTWVSRRRRSPIWLNMYTLSLRPKHADFPHVTCIFFSFFLPFFHRLIIIISQHERSTSPPATQADVSAVFDATQNTLACRVLGLFEDMQHVCETCLLKKSTSQSMTQLFADWLTACFLESTSASRCCFWNEGKVNKGGKWKKKSLWLSPTLLLSLLLCPSSVFTLHSDSSDSFSQLKLPDFLPQTAAALPTPQISVLQSVPTNQRAPTRSRSATPCSGFYCLRPILRSSRCHYTKMMWL